MAELFINNTNHSIIISDGDSKAVILPNKSSRDIGVFDADYFFIERPTIFEGKLYSNGLIKFCDFSTINLNSNGKADKVNPSVSAVLCKVINDFGWYNSSNEFLP